MKLYYYWNLETNKTCWAINPEDYRQRTGEKSGVIVRAASGDKPATNGFQKTGRLGNDPAVATKKKSATRELLGAL